jgi:hypothetical protein
MRFTWKPSTGYWSCIMLAVGMFILEAVYTAIGIRTDIPLWLGAASFIGSTLFIFQMFKDSGYFKIRDIDEPIEAEVKA